jgi:hypothetical protein
MANSLILRVYDVLMNHRVRFLESDRLTALEVPEDDRLQASAKSIASAMQGSAASSVRQACAEFLSVASGYYLVRQPAIRVLAARPRSSASGTNQQCSPRARDCTQRRCRYKDRVDEVERARNRHSNWYDTSVRSSVVVRCIFCALQVPFYRTGVCT